MRDAIAQHTGSSNVNVSVSQEQTSGQNRAGIICTTALQQANTHNADSGPVTNISNHDASHVPVQRQSHSLIDYCVMNYPVSQSVICTQFTYILEVYG